jgi:hypothetical protein
VVLVFLLLGGGRRRGIGHRHSLLGLGPAGGLHGLLAVAALEGAGLEVVDGQAAAAALRVCDGHLRLGRGTHVVVQVVAGGVVVVVGAGDRRRLRPLRGHEGSWFVVGCRRQRQILARWRVHGALLVAVTRC